MLLLEPDATPIKDDWLERLWVEVGGAGGGKITVLVRQPPGVLDRIAVDVSPIVGGLDGGVLQRRGRGLNNV